MSEQTENQSQNSQSTNQDQTNQNSNLNNLSKGQEGSILSNAASVTEHKADPVHQNTPKQDESKKDIPVNSSTEEEYELELSEGSPLSDEDFNEIVELASQKGLSKQEAENLIKQREGIYSKALSKFEAQKKEKIEAAVNEIKSHPDFIGEKYTKSFESIGRAVKAFGDDTLIEALKSPEIGNNLALALFLKKIGDAMSPDSFEGKGSPSIESPSDKEQSLQKLYPDFFKK